MADEMPMTEVRTPLIETLAAFTVLSTHRD
jgi:hypothetical protein